MNYQYHYEQLCIRAKGRTIDTYTEEHHIIPRCMNGTNASYNLVKLTAKEHYVAHLLLYKMFPNHTGLAFAAFMMGGNSRKYESLRKIISTNMKSNNPNANGKARLAYIAKHGKSPKRNYSPSKELNAANSRRMKTNNPNADGVNFTKKCYLLDDQGQIVHTFDKISQARRFCNANHGSILNNKRRNTMYRGYYWKFEGEL